MNVLLNQMPALMGVVVGVLGTHLTTRRNDAARWRREHAARWDAERRAAYAAYGYAVKSLITQSARLAATRGISGSERFAVVDLEEGTRELHRLATERAALWESVLLLGTGETIEACRRWHAVATELEKFADGKRTDSDQWLSLYREAGVARDGFYLQARQDPEIRD